MTQHPRQLELELNREKEKDRNHHLGGRSFYFFDFDDNVAFLSTPLYLFHRDNKSEIAISSGDFAQFHSFIGKSGTFKDYTIDYDDSVGTFRAFRDHHISDLEKLNGKKQIFIQDVAAALGFPDLAWKGPSWDCFFHATFNQRPVSVITARGHHPQTIQNGIGVFVERGFLPNQPNYLSVFPVSHKETRAKLGDSEFTDSVASLKQKAIRASVQKALQIYGYSAHHRFGMSDDDPKNIQLVLEEMMRLKEEYPEMSFFIVETQKGEYLKKEVLLQHNYREKKVAQRPEQITLFES
ncbi:MAG: hypothetical protein AB7O96_17070 [Pseudobdellovibrionaceae bacterium]